MSVPSGSPKKQIFPLAHGGGRKGAEDKGKVFVNGGGVSVRTKRSASISRNNIYGNLESSDILRSDSTDFYRAEFPTIRGVLADPNVKEASWDDDFDIEQESPQCK